MVMDDQIERDFSLLQMSDAMAMIASFVNKRCDPSPSFALPSRPSSRTSTTSTPLFQGMQNIKERLGQPGPGPVAEQLEVVDSLPLSERFAAAAGIRESHRQGWTV